MPEQGLQAILATLGNLKAALTEIHHRIQAIDSDLEHARSEVESWSGQSLGGPGQTGAGVPAATLSFDLANGFIRKLGLGRTQGEVLEIYLQETGSHVGRGILFLRRNGEFAPWKTIGFPSEALGEVVAGDPDDPIVRCAEQKRVVYRRDALDQAFPWLARVGGEPAGAVCMPLVFQDFVPVVFYGDSAGPISLDVLEFLTHLTVLVLKNQALEQLVQETREAVAAAAVSEETGVEEPVPEEEAMTAPADEISLEEASVEGLREEVSAEEAPVKDASLEVETSGVEPGVEVEEPAPAARDDSPTWISPPEKASAAPSWGSAPLQSPVEAPPAEGEASPDDRDGHEPSVESVPALEGGDAAAVEEPQPEPVAAEEPRPALSEEEERLHNEARRFARLLVSEIKLYNEEHVQIGREKADLYERLRTDVDRSREMYDRRVSPSVASTADYFHDEIVRILAQGDPALLGTGYPGPTRQ